MSCLVWDMATFPIACGRQAFIYHYKTKIRCYKTPAVFRLEMNNQITYPLHINFQNIVQTVKIFGSHLKKTTNYIENLTYSKAYSKSGENLVSLLTLETHSMYQTGTGSQSCFNYSPGQYLASGGCPLDVHNANRKTDFLPCFWAWHLMETGNYSKHFFILKYLEIM